jgi:hypothetical protein
MVLALLWLFVERPVRHRHIKMQLGLLRKRNLFVDAFLLAWTLLDWSGSLIKSCFRCADSICWWGAASWAFSPPPMGQIQVESASKVRFAFASVEPLGMTLRVGVSNRDA